MLSLRHEVDDVRVPSVPGQNEKKTTNSQNEITGSTLASTNPPAIGVLYNFLVTPGYTVPGRMKGRDRV